MRKKKTKKKKKKLNNNFLITGKRQVGKSSLIKQVCQELNLAPCGFVTLAKYDNLGNRQGFYYHTLLPVFICHELVNDLPIMIGLTPVFETFSSLGISTLKAILLSDNHYVILDEIGRIEKNNEEYINLLNQILCSDKLVLASLKKENIPFIEAMKKRMDVYVYDLDILDYNLAKEDIIKKLKEGVKL